MTATRVVRFTSFEDLAAHAGDWDRLAQGSPFRGWPWMSCWWRHYGDQAGGQLFVLGVFDDIDRLVGVAPWYLAVSPWRGRVVRFLGTGEVCSEYLGVMAVPGLEDMVSAAIADWLDAANGPDAWDLLELTSIPVDDAATARLAERMEAGGHRVHRRAGPTCWQIDLPPTWDDYLAKLSKEHRNHLRKADRRLLKTGRAVVHRVRRPDDLPRGLQILIDLHQERRRAMGEAGCFASHRFTAFHREVMIELLGRGQLDLFWIDLDGTPFVAEYLLIGGTTVSSYQSGLDVERLHDSPGRLGNVVCLRSAIEHGYRTFDFLRGDEPYKAHFRACPVGTVEVRVAAASLPARLRHGLWLAGSRTKQWLRGRRESCPSSEVAEHTPAAATSASAAQPAAAGSLPAALPQS